MTREYRIDLKAHQPEVFRDGRFVKHRTGLLFAIAERLEALVDAVDDLTQATRVNPVPKLENVSDAIGEAVEKVVKP